jgi:GntR family transcriptional regulator/MocR family aminotransferase
MHATFIPPIALDFDSTTPLYRQISVWFQRAIRAGQLRPGQRVPSTRALAKELRISRIPVQSAYELLIAEGYLEPFVGAGTCVCQSIPDAFPRPGRDNLPTTTAVIDSPPRGRRTVSRRAAGMRGPAQMWLRECHGCTDLQHFPIALWSKLVSRHLREMSSNIMGYGEPMGYWPFREALAEYLGAFRAVSCHPSQILVTTGSQQALQISALALLDPKDEVWLEEPGYPGTQQALKAAGARLVPVPVDGNGLDLAYGIRHAPRARAIYVTPARQYPMSVTMSATRRIELLSWATRNGAWIVEDDYDSEFRYTGNPIASLQGLDADGRVIYVGTLTKVMFPALRLGFMVVPKDLVETFVDLRNATDTVSTPVLYQMAMTDFIREGHFSRHIKRMRTVYQERRRALAEAVRLQAQGVLEVVGIDAGLSMVVLLPSGIDDVEVAHGAPRMTIGVFPLSRCFAAPPERGGLIISYANIDPKEIPAMIGALKSIVESGRPSVRAAGNAWRQRRSCA